MLRFRLYALVKDSHLAVALVFVAKATNGLWQRNSSREEKGYHYLYGSWRLIMDWKPVDHLCPITVNQQWALTTSSYP